MRVLRLLKGVVGVLFVSMFFNGFAFLIGTFVPLLGILVGVLGPLFVVIQMWRNWKPRNMDGALVALMFIVVFGAPGLWAGVWL